MNALLLLAALAFGAGDVEGVAQEEDKRYAEMVEQVTERLRGDADFREQLARRIAQSAIAPRITEEEDPKERLRVIRAWVEQNPGPSADIGIGLAKDDASGSTNFQDTVNRTTISRLHANPNASKGIFGRLKKASRDSMKMGKDEEMAGEERNEILRTLFEGKGSGGQKIVTELESGASRAGDKIGVSATGLGAQSYFDRLGAGNLRGYSPQLMAMQSALNARRPPGAPKLIESGKLDYATLSYPGHGMRFDLGNLEKRLRQQRAYALAKALGLERRYTAEQLLDPRVEAELKAKAAGAKLPARFAARDEALSKAAAALAAFDAAALAAQDPTKITKALLVELGGKQKEAARWLTVASLEEELQRIEAEEAFWTPELEAAIKACPVAEGSKQSYLKRGQGYRRTLADLKANTEGAKQLLLGEDWAARLAEVDARLAKNGLLRKDLSRNISDFVNTAFRLASGREVKPRWRELLDSLFVKYLPNSERGRLLAREQRHQALLRDVFEKIAAGDLEAAHTMLASSEPRPAGK